MLKLLKPRREKFDAVIVEKKVIINKISCLRNAQVISSSSQSAKNQSCENQGHAQASRRWRDVGEIDDKKAEEDSQDENEDFDEEDAEDDMDDWTLSGSLPGIHLLKAKTGHLCHSSDVKYGVLMLIIQM